MSTYTIKITERESLQMVFDYYVEKVQELRSELTKTADTAEGFRLVKLATEIQRYDLEIGKLASRIELDF